MRILLTALSMLVSAATSATPPSDASAFVQIELRPVELRQAIREFEHICLATSFDRGRFDAALQHSQWRFVADPRRAQFQDRQIAPEAAVVLNAPPLPAALGFGMPQCNFDAVARIAPSRSDLYAAIESALLRSQGLVPARQIDRTATCWRWAPSREAISRLCLMQVNGAEPDQITLSYQFWTPEWEARAGMIPAAGNAR